MRYITAVILASLSAILIVGYAYPTYESVAKLEERVVELQGYVEKATKAQAKIDELDTRYKAFPIGANERMNTMIPEKIDDVRLTMDITDLAAVHGISLANPSIKKIADDKTGQIQKYLVSFSVEAPYNTFRRFLNDIEYWLQIRDITNLSLTAGETLQSPMQIKMDFITYSLQ